MSGVGARGGSIRREVVWAASVFAQLLALGLLTPLGRLLLELEAVRKLFRIPDEAILVPLLLALALLVPLAVAVCTLVTIQLIRPQHAQAGFLLHLFAAYVGCAAASTIAWVGSGENTSAYSTGILLAFAATPPLAALLYWPRLLPCVSGIESEPDELGVERLAPRS